MSYILWKPKGSVGDLGGGTTKVLTFDATLSEDHKWSSTITDHPVELGADIADHVRKDLDELTLEVFISNSPVEPRLAQVQTFHGLVDEAVPMVATKGQKPLSVKALVLQKDLRVQELHVDLAQPKIALTPAGLAVSLVQRGLRAIKPPHFTATAGLQSSVKNREAVALVQWFENPVDVVALVGRTLYDLRSNATLVTVYTPKRIYEDMALKEIRLKRDDQTGDGARFSLDFREVRTVSTKFGEVPLPSLKKAEPKVDVGAKTSAVTDQGSPGSVLSALKDYADKNPGTPLTSAIGLVTGK